MQRSSHLLLTVALCLGIGLWLGACPGAPTADDLTGTSDTTGTSLTSAEQDSLDAVTSSSKSLAEAVNTAQSPTGGGSESASDIPSVTQTQTFGVCPQVTLTTTNDGLLTFNMTVSFGTGCHPLGDENYTCSGQASGSFDQRQKNMNMTFENISCQSATLTGDVNVNYDRSATQVDVDGDWDLTYVDSYGTILTDGSGSGNYHLTQYVTTVDTFTGTVTDGTSAYQSTVTGIKISFPTYGVFMPYAGEIAVSGTGIRSYVVRFNENSPSTGIVEVSIAGGPYFQVPLYAP